MILAQPTSKPAFIGDASATFQVFAAGSPTPTYQWQVKSALPPDSIFADVPGATGATLTLPNPIPSVDGNQYRCVVTSGSSIPSAAATLKVYPAPSMSPPAATVSPATIAADSAANITIQVTGLVSPGDSPRIERILDLNGNGIADFGEPLVQSFVVTDGQSAWFGGQGNDNSWNEINGGVKNPNIPGDDESGIMNRKITTHISLPNSPEMGRTAGSYVIRISSPTGQFTTITKTLTVTQPDHAQSVSGQVTSGGLPAPYAAVAAVESAGTHNYVASAVTDASGNFTLKLPAGSYALAAVKTGYVASIATAPTFALAAGQTLAGKNPALAAATCSISGKAQNLSGNQTLPGVQLNAGSATGDMAIAFSDSDGNYVLPSLAGQWTISASDSSMNALGSLRPNTNPTATTTTGNTTALDLSFTPATSMVYGTVKTPAGAAMPGVLVESGDDPNNSNDRLYSSNVTTDADGKYFLGMAGTTSWRVRVNEQAALSPYIMPDNRWTNPSPNAANQVNFSANQVTAHLQGTVTKNGTAVSGAPITAYVSNNDITVSTITDSNGYFDLGVMGEMWDLSIDGDWAQANNLVCPSLSFTLSNNQTITGIVWPVLASTGTVTGSVRDPFNNPVTGGQWVYAYTTIDNMYYEVGANIDASGNCSLTIVSGYNWSVGGDGCGNDQTVLVQSSAQVNLVRSAITNAPSDQTIPVGGNAMFSVTVNAPSPTIQWQRLPIGSDWDTGWIALADSTTYSGTSTDTLTVHNTTGSMAGDYFRCVVSYAFNGTTPITNTSDSARLAVVVAHLLGTVSNNGTGVSGIHISGYCPSVMGGVSTTTGPDGRFDLGVSANGTWIINVDRSYASANNLVAPNLPITVTNGQSVPNIDYQLLDATGKISGSVKDSGGNSVTNVYVWAASTIDGLDYDANVLTDASGNYSLPVINGTWTVGVGANNFPQQTVAVTGSHTVNFLQGGVVAHAFGTVTKNGSPVAGATVLASQGPLWVSATTGPDGTFDLGVTATGSWSLSLAPNYAEANNLVRTMQQVQMNGNVSSLEIKIADGTGTISGSVKDANNSPLTNVGVHAFAMVGGTQFYAYANTNGSGVYSLPTINGTWDVSVLQTGYNTRTVAVNGSAVANFAPTTAHFLGTLTLAGEFLPYTVILAVPMDGNLADIVSATADGSGNFDLGVSPGSWAIRISPDWANSLSAIGPSIYKTVNSAPTTISGIAYEVLSGTGRIYGNVRDANGNPVTNTNVWASTTIGGVEYNGSAHTDASGTYSFPSLRGQTWWVDAAEAGYSAQQIAVDGLAEVNFGPSQHSVWQSQFTPSEIAAGKTGLTADFDGDGVANLIEYAFRKNPKIRDATGIAVDVVSGKMQISFPCDATRTDIVYTAQASSNLATWIDIATSVRGATTTPVYDEQINPLSTVSDTGIGLRTVTVADTSVIGRRRFLRVTISDPTKPLPTPTPYPPPF